MAKRILIVDDEEEIRWVLQEFFEAHGIECGLAPNGQEALEILSVQKFDLVLSDIRMPLLDGIALLERIKELPNPPAVILMTGYSNVSVHEAKSKGAIEVIAKPFSMNKILDIVLNALK